MKNENVILNSETDFINENKKIQKNDISINSEKNNIENNIILKNILSNKIQENSSYNNIFNILSNKNDKNNLNNISQENNDNSIEEPENIFNMDDKIDINKPRLFGNLKPILFYNNEPIFLISPEYFNFIIYYGICLIIYLFLRIFFIKKFKLILMLFYDIYFILFSLNFIIISFMNPGIPKNKKNLNIEILKKNYLQCHLCNNIIFKDNDYITFHCMICDCCIEDFDHHCSYATKCIGKNNKTFFYLWLISIILYIFINFIYVLFFIF